MRQQLQLGGALQGVVVTDLPLMVAQSKPPLQQGLSLVLGVS